MAKQAQKVENLSRRERQIMDALYRLGKASASEVREALTNPPTYTTVRTLLGILVAKGHAKHESDGTRYIYEPVVPKDEMATNVILGVIQNFFGGSVERVVSTLVHSDQARLSKEELDRISEIIEKAKEEGR